MNLMKTTLLAAALLAVAPLASAATATTTFQVRLQLNNACTVAISDLVFPTSTTLAANIDASTTGNVTCTGIGAYAVTFNNGAGTGATTAARRMSGPSAATINYVLATDAARTVLLGTTGTGTIAGTSTGAAIPFTVFGRVAGGQGAKPVGAYVDTVTATVTF